VARYSPIWPVEQQPWTVFGSPAAVSQAIAPGQASGSTGGWRDDRRRITDGASSIGVRNAGCTAVVGVGSSAVVLATIQDQRSVTTSCGGGCLRRPTGDERWDVFLAALAEYLSGLDNRGTAAWAAERRLEVFWFPFNTAAARVDAFVHSPASFRRRGIFVAPQELGVA